MFNLVDDVISAVGRISGDVSDGPDGLLLNVLGGRGQQLDEDGDGSGLDDHSGLRRGPAGDVGKGSGGLELECRVVGGAKELDETWNDAWNKSCKSSSSFSRRHSLYEVHNAKIFALKYEVRIVNCRI